MSKKLTLSLVAVAVVIAGVALTSAFEVHIINVTAHIENALSVEPKEIAFGTVFPQEYVEEEFTITLSDSFMEEDRVDDVTYEIKQKPKCICDDLNYQDLAVCPEGKYAAVGYATHQCPAGYSAMLDLCPFLSKIPAQEEEGDYGVPSYYVEDASGNYCTAVPLPSEPNHGSGKLTKSDGDTSDTWIVDLKVPPVEGYIGQDWPASCAEWVVSKDSQDYGCDLWIEVTGISLPEENGGPGICAKAPDVMQVLDKSGSIDSGELTVLKTAANAFVDAMAPSTDGTHMGVVSFASNASLDQELTSDGTAVKAAINDLTSGNMTNLGEAIIFATTELDSSRDRDDAGDSPDYMVIITDGNPTAGEVPYDDYAENAADAADTAGITIYVVGIGSDVNAGWLASEIATDPTYYYGVANWSDLQAILEGIGTCPQV